MKNIITLSPFKRFCMTVGNLPATYVESLTYQELLYWLCNYLEKTVIPTIDNNAGAVQELQNLFTELQSYVNNYFSSLDVQEEINNKLDEMTQNGTLQEIMLNYINRNVTLVFNNVESMKQATNLIEGSNCRTLGYYFINDGGGSNYLIRTKNENDNVNKPNIIFLNNGLVAELVIENNEVNVKQLGVIANLQENNNAQILNNAIQNGFCSNFFIPKGKYYFNDSISLLPRVNIRGNFDYDYIINYSENMIIFNNSHGFINCDKNIFESLALYGNKDNATDNIAFYHDNKGNAPIIKKCVIYNFKTGIEGNNRSVVVSDCIIKHCDIGINNFTDSKITQNTISECITGISLDHNGDDSILNNRIEWCDEYGIYVYGGWNYLINNNLIDRCGLNGIMLRDVTRSILNNNFLRRNYASANGNTENKVSHIYVLGCHHLSINGNMTNNNHIIDGDTTSAIEPANGIYITESSFITTTSNDFTGCNNKPIVYSPYLKNVLIDDVTNAIDNTYFNVTANTSQLFELDIAFISETGLVPQAIEMYISYRAGNNTFYSVIEKTLSFINDNDNIIVENYEYTENNLIINVVGIENNKLKINVTNNNSTAVRVCISHKMLLFPYNSSYNYTE